VAEVIKFEVVMSIFVNSNPHLTTFISDFLSYFDISFAGSKVSGVAEVIEFEVVTTFISDFLSYFDISFAGSKVSGVAEVIEFEFVMSIFINSNPHLTTFISDFLSYFNISFAGSKVAGVAEVIEFEVVMSIFVTLGPALTTFINDFVQIACFWSFQDGQKDAWTHRHRTTRTKLMTR
jgi:hypothetical protein